MRGARPFDTGARGGCLATVSCRAVRCRLSDGRAPCVMACLHVNFLIYWKNAP